MRSKTIIACFMVTVLPSCFAQVSLASLKSLDLPHYPLMAKLARIEGEVKVAIEVAPSGAVVLAQAAGQQELLNEYAKRNVVTWHFQPSGEDNPHPLKINVIYRFKISGAASDQGFERITIDRDSILIETNPPVLNASRATTR